MKFAKPNTRLYRILPDKAWCCWVAGSRRGHTCCTCRHDATNVACMHAESTRPDTSATCTDVATNSSCMHRMNESAGSGHSGTLNASSHQNSRQNSRQATPHSAVSAVSGSAFAAADVECRASGERPGSQLSNRHEESSRSYSRDERHASSACNDSVGRLDSRTELPDALQEVEV